MPRPVRAVLSLGSNLGDRLDSLASGLEALRDEGLVPKALSSVYETPAIGYLQQPPFLNMVALVETSMSGLELLERVRRVEEKMGRERPFPNAPRTLDVDLVFVGTSILREPGLRVPHPRWKGRSFVIRPLLEVAPELRDPETGLLVREIAEAWPARPEKIRIVEGPGVLGPTGNEGVR